MKKFMQGKKLMLGLLVLGVVMSIQAVTAGLSDGVRPSVNLDDLAVNDLKALEDPVLDSLRGGFASADKIEITFGYESILKVDGVLQTRLSLNIPKIVYDPVTRQVSYSSIQATSFKSGNLAEGLTVQTPGGDGVSGLQLAQAFLSSPLVIQNTANNRLIQHIQNVNLGIKGVTPSFNAGVNKVLTPALIDSLR